MTERVAEKIQELKRIQSEEYYKKKDADLYAWELTEKDERGKEVPITITNEEYEALIAASNGVNTLASRNNVAKGLNVIAVCTIVVGFIIGFALMTFAESSGFVYFSITMLLSLLMAALFWGLAEAIKLLQQLIDRKTAERPAEVADAPVSQTQAQPQPQQIPVQMPVAAARPQAPQYPAYVQPQVQAQPQYQVTYTTAAPPFVQVQPQQYMQPQQVQYQQVPPTMPR